jgi:hypothetical protein
MLAAIREYSRRSGQPELDSGAEVVRAANCKGLGPAKDKPQLQHDHNYTHGRLLVRPSWRSSLALTNIGMII